MFHFSLSLSSSLESLCASEELYSMFYFSLSVSRDHFVPAVKVFQCFTFHFHFLGPWYHFVAAVNVFTMFHFSFSLCSSLGSLCASSECIYNVSLSICTSQIHITLCGQNQLGGGGGGHYIVTDQCRSSVQSGPFLGSVLSNELKKETNTPNVSWNTNTCTHTDV